MANPDRRDAIEVRNGLQSNSSPPNMVGRPRKPYIPARIQRGSMRKIAVIVGAIILVGAIAAAIIPMWTMSAGVGMSRGGYASVVLMVIFCFAVGGGLMFLIFYSSRRGY